MIEKVVLPVIISFITLNHNIESKVYGTKASLSNSSFCEKYKCKLIEKSDYSKAAGVLGTVQSFHVVYPIEEGQSTEGNYADFTVYRDKTNIIIGVSARFFEDYSGQLISYADSQFATDLAYLMVGKKYVMRPNMGDDMSSLCFSYLDKDHQYKVLTKGSVTTSSGEKKPYVVYCDILPGSPYPNMFPVNEERYKVKPMLEIFSSVQFKPAKQFDPSK